MSNLPYRLSQIVEDFQLCQGREKLELLLEYANSLQPLPESITIQQAGMDQVQECMTPVYVHAEIDQGRLSYYFDVPDQSPTVRGYASLMAEGVNGSRPEEVLGIPADFFREMGLDQVLTQQRLNGISAILAHMKRLAIQYI